MSRIIIELKIMEHAQKIHFAQVKNYLKTIHYRLGSLIDFGGQLWNSKE